MAKINFNEAKLAEVSKDWGFEDTDDEKVWLFLTNYMMEHYSYNLGSVRESWYSQIKDVVESGISGKAKEEIIKHMDSIWKGIQERRQQVEVEGVSPYAPHKYAYGSLESLARLQRADSLAYVTGWNKFVIYFFDHRIKHCEKSLENLAHQKQEYEELAKLGNAEAARVAAITGEQVELNIPPQVAEIQ